VLAKEVSKMKETYGCKCQATRAHEARTERGRGHRERKARIRIGHGYRLVASRRSDGGVEKKVVLDPEEALVVRSTYEDFSQGKNIEEIMERLNEEAEHREIGLSK
jgi:hypothetical protein